MNKRWNQVKEFFSRPKVIKWTIVILTLMIIIGVIKAFVWTIYTKDKPAFVPEEVREDIQGVIKESGETLKSISKPVGTAIVDSAYQKPAPVVANPTENWKTYNDQSTGISMKYPTGWGVFKGEEGVFSFAPDEDSYSFVVIYSFPSINQEPDEWFFSKADKEISDYFLLERKKIGERIFYVIKNREGMEDLHYVTIINHVAFDISYGGALGYEKIESIISTINF